MKKRFKKLTALFLALSMTLWMSGGAYASEVSMDDVPETTVSEDVMPGDDASEDVSSTPEETGSEETGEAVGSAEENGVTAAMTIAAKLKDEAISLQSLTPGLDYSDGEGVIIVPTKEEAEKIAAEYGGKLTNYAQTVATIDFGRSTIDALNETAKAMTATKVVEPNYFYFIDGVRPDPESIQKDSNDTLSFEEAQPSNIEVEGSKDNGVESSITAAEKPNDPWADSSDTYYQWYHEKIHTLEAHATATGKGVTVAVIDTGIYAPNKDFKSDTIVDQISAFSDGIDTDGHGSNCAGIIGAEKGNGVHGFGVASDAVIHSIKTLGENGATNAQVTEAIIQATNESVQVISMSLGGPSYSDAMQEACTSAAEQGITVIAAAGNESTDEVHYPAGYDNVISVASAEKDDTLSDFSNYGDWVDIVACGGKFIYSEAPYGSSKDYTAYAGTSQATPQVAAVAALMYEANPSFTDDTTIDTPNAIRKILLSTTDGKEYKYSSHVVKGLLQADAAVTKAKEYEGSNNGSSYTIVDPAGWYGRILSGRICQGGSLKLAIGDASGNVKAAKSVAKTAVWASDNPAAIAVKKGRVKCNKTAAVGTKVKVTATIGTSVVTYKFVVAYKPKMFGICNTSIKKSGHKYKYVYKFQPSMTGSGKVGGIYTLTNPSYLTGGKARLMWDINKKTGFYYYYSANTSYRYDISISKGQLKKMTVEYGQNGKPVRIQINSPGKYTVKYKVLDGSNKTFKIVIKV